MTGRSQARHPGGGVTTLLYRDVSLQEVSGVMLRMLGCIHLAGRATQNQVGLLGMLNPETTTRLLAET